MHILIVSQYWHPENGVPQRRWAWLTQQLIAMGHKVTVIAPPPHYDRNSDEPTLFSNRRPELGPHGETILRSNFVKAADGILSRAWGQGCIAFFTFTRIFGRNGIRAVGKPDLVIGTVPAIPTAFVTSAIARTFKVPYFIDLRDAWPDLLKQARRWNESVGQKSWWEQALNSGPMFVFERIIRIAMYRVLNKAGSIIVTSEWLKRALANNPHLNKHNEDSIITIRNVFPASSNFKKKVSFNNDRPLRVLYAGTIGRAQHLTNVIDAAQLANDQGVPVEIRFVGEGAAKKNLVEYASRHDVNVEFFDKVPSSKLEQHYAWADSGLVHLSDWEPLKRAVPSKTYELLDLEVHISAAIAGETTEIIQESEGGFAVPPLNPQRLMLEWKKIIDNPSLLKIGSAAYTWLRRERSLAAERLIRLAEDSLHRVPHE